MIEVGAPEVAGMDPAAAAQERTAGAMLRDAREAAGLHVAALAAAMKVPVAKLDALENDRHDLLPDAVFVRALASSICRTLKIDPAPVLALLPRTGKPRLVQDTDGLNAPFRSPRDAVAPRWKEQLTRPVSLTVGVLLAGAVVVLLLPRPADEAPAVDSASSVDSAAGAPTLPTAQGSGEAVAPAADFAPAKAPPEVMTASVALPSAPTAAAPGPLASRAASASDAAPAAMASASAATAAASGLIVFRASAESWIEVRDAKGAVPVRKLLTAGETTGVSGALPLQVTVGNAGATQVQVRGKPFDLRAITRDNVARFEVK